MTLILGLRGHHGNTKFEIEGNFISFKWKKKFFYFPRVVFEILDFKEGRTRNYQKISSTLRSCDPAF